MSREIILFKHIETHLNYSKARSVKGLKGTVVNQGCFSLNGRFLEITLTIPLILCNLLKSGEWIHWIHISKATTNPRSKFLNRESKDQAFICFFAVLFEYSLVGTFIVGLSIYSSNLRNDTADIEINLCRLALFRSKASILEAPLKHLFSTKENSL